MREFSWNVFAVTGNIDAYLLYKDCCEMNQDNDEERLEEEDRVELGQA